MINFSSVYVSRSPFSQFWLFKNQLWILLMFSCSVFGFCCLSLKTVWLYSNRQLFTDLCSFLLFGSLLCHLQLPQSSWILTLLVSKTSVCFILHFPLCSMTQNILKRQEVLKGKKWSSYRAHLICFPSLRHYNFVLPMFQCLKTVS